MTWVNFRELREKLDFREVLAYYDVEINAKNHVQHHGRCPLPTHKGRKHSPTFSAHLEKKIWRCFGPDCGQGNILDFVAVMEGLDPKKSDDVRQAALIIGRRFSIVSEKPKAKEPAATKKAGQGRVCPAVTNAPLDFELKGLDPGHPYLAKRGLAPTTIDHFGLGYCARGLMQGRIAIPLRTPHGLIGYAGRVVDDSLISDENPKYRFPAPREHERKRFAFDKSLFLYNGDRLRDPVDDLIVVEGFPSVWWLWQHGYRNVVGLMGANISSEQAGLIVGLVPRKGRVWIFSDGNQAGRYCAEGGFRLVGPLRFVRWVELKDGRKPTHCNQDELRTLIDVAPIGEEELV